MKPALVAFCFGVFACGPALAQVSDETPPGDIIVYGRSLPQIGIALSGSEGVVGYKDYISYFYASRLPGERAGGVEDRHIHPVEPRQARVTLRAAF
jgi:hypothetical protein